MGWLIAGMLIVAVQGAVPLTEPQRVQLDSATDFGSRFDEAALYPLLQNALAWEARDEAGAVVPDYAAILKAPADYRGTLFLIEGLFAGTPRGGTLLVTPLSRGGAWDDRLQQWVVVVDPVKDAVAAVYLVDPPPAPSAGAKVRLVARFYKVFADQDRHGRPMDYLTFVGKSAVVQASPTARNTSWGVGPLLGAMLLLTGSWYVLRRTLRAKPLRMGLPRRQGPEKTTDPVIDDGPSDEMALPKDPAQALQTLWDMHGQEQAQEE